MRSITFGVVAIIYYSLACGARAESTQTSKCHIRVPLGLSGSQVHQAAKRLASQAFDLPLQGTEDIHVCFDEGVHALGGEPLTLTAAHNHPNGGRVIWRPTQSDGSAPILTGGIQLSDWGHCDDGEHCPGSENHEVWFHPTAGLPNVTSADLPFRQLWVNGERAVRVTEAGAEFDLKAIATGYVSGAALPGRVSQWASNQAELRWPSQIRNWIEPRCVVVATGANNMTIAPECWGNLTARNNGKLPPPPVWIENTGRPLQPGEFWSTPDYIFYRPTAQDPYSPPQDAWVPLLGLLINASDLEGHTFSGLQFAHSTWRAPSTDPGYVPGQTIVTGSFGEPKGAVRFQHCKDLTVQGCSFRNMGAAYGLEIGNASQGAVVSQCSFYDLSGGAVKLGNVEGDRCLSKDPADVDGPFLLEESVMEDISVEFRGGAAVFAGYVAGTNISHNNITNTGYTGISLGWGWGTHVKGPQTFAADNHVTGNRLSGVMQGLNDGGCIYTLGPQPRTTITRNSCRGDRAPVVGCVYNDNGSRYINSSYNVVDNSPAPAHYLQGCCNSPAYDCHVSHLWARATAPVRNECAAEDCTVDNSTVVYLKAGDAWPAEAQAIIDASGAH